MIGPGRRRLLHALAAWAAAAASGRAADAAEAGGADPDPVRRGRALVFPRDHGAHLGARTEWWYATGWAGSEAVPTHGVQVTFFRSRTGLGDDLPGRFAPRQLLFAHAAITDLGAGRHAHADRIARWSGQPAADPAGAVAWASTDDADLRLGDWTFRREGATWRARIPSRELLLELELERTQPVLLQGDAGFSRKGPDERQASHYYSEPQLALAGRAGIGRDAPRPLRGRAWLDHEWSEEIMHPEAVGWDWIGINLFDGGALTAFQLRRADGRALWAGGSHRPPGGAPLPFAADAVRFRAGRRWTSPATAASYPLEWEVDTPAGRHVVRALLDAQELDSRTSTGTIYWEGLAELLDAGGRRVGLGYLELTGYASRLRL